MGDQAPHAPRPARAKHTDAVHRPHPGVPPRAQPAAARTHQLTRAQPPIDLNRVGTYHHHWVHLHAPSTALPSGQGTGRAVALLGHGQPAVAHDEGATPTAAPHNRHRAERRYPTAPSSTSSSFNMRSLLRFLHITGVIEAPLAAAVPSMASWKLTGLPKALPGEQVTALLASCERDSMVGRRDLAVLTVLVRLGLRAGEVASLRLTDVDWQSGEITVRGKGNRSDRLPLPPDVGDVLVAYLTSGHPGTAAA